MNKFYIDYINNLTESNINMLTTSTNLEKNYPKVNHIVFKDGTELLEFAVAGFAKDEIKVLVEGEFLTVSGEHNKKNINSLYPELVEYVTLQQGIANRAFSVKYKLAAHTEVSDVVLQNGILYVKVRKNIPEEKKPKYLNIVG